jgi:hypothetical protein
MLNTSNISTYWHSSGIPVLWLSKFKLDKFHLELAAELFATDKKLHLGTREYYYLKIIKIKYLRNLE